MSEQTLPFTMALLALSLEEHLATARALRRPGKARSKRVVSLRRREVTS